MPDSERMADGIPSVAATTIGAMVFGSRWRNMIRPRLAPSDSAAVEKSCYLSEIVLARTMRETVSQLISPRPMYTPTNPPVALSIFEDVLPESARVAVQGAAQEGHDNDHEEQARHRIENVDDAHDHGVDLAAEESGGQPGRHADQQDHRLHDDPDRQRDPRAEDEPDEDVAPELVGAHRVFPGWALGDRVVVLLGVGRGLDSGTKIAARPRTMMKTAEMTASLFRVSWRRRCPRSPRPCRPVKAAISADGTQRRMLRWPWLVAHSRIKQRIEEVHDQVHDRDQRPEQQHRAQDDRVVPRGDRFDEVAADTRHLIDRLDEERAGHDIGQDDRRRRSAPAGARSASRGG